MAQEAKKKTKRPTAEKRIIQSDKRRMRNRIFKSRIKSAMKAFKAAVEAKDQGKITEELRSVYSLMDKGVKLGIYKKNKAARTKKQYAAQSA